MASCSPMVRLIESEAVLLTAVELILVEFCPAVPTMFKVGRRPARIRSISRTAPSSAASCARTGQPCFAPAVAPPSIQLVLGGLGALFHFCPSPPPSNFPPLPAHL